jgi:phenylpyruvate tautomerase PptA (4-oxalocrotonate tautomerase family)
MLKSINMPANDRFQVITEHPAENFFADPNYLNISRSSGCIFIQITLNKGRTLEVKKALYQTIADSLHDQLGMRREDVVISLVEVDKENWSFGNGIAQYA